MDNYKQSKRVNKPEIYKDKWLKFNKTVLYPMEINDCNDTIDGVCFKNLTFDECVEKCVDDCDFGYHVKTAKESICVPIRSKINSDSDPSFRLRNQNIYNFEDDVSITYFQNKYVYPYPPSDVYVYYNSRINIKVYDDKDAYMEIDINKNNSGINIGKNGTNMILQPKISNTIIDNTTKVRYNDYLTIHIPVTSLTMRVNEGQKISFEILDSEIKNRYQKFAPRNLFYFENINGDEEYIKWFEPLYIKTLRGSYLNVINNKITISQEKGTVFCLTPQLIPYYCNNGVCESTNIENVVMNKAKDSLEIKDSKGIINKVSFNNSCWNNCKSNLETVNAGKNNHNIFIMIISSIFLIILVFVIALVIKNRVEVPLL